MLNLVESHEKYRQKKTRLLRLGFCSLALTDLLSIDNFLILLHKIFIVNLSGFSLILYSFRYLLNTQTH